jgi:hypothetical protein
MPETNLTPTVATALAEARRLIEQRGWRQGVIEDASGALCIVEAICLAVEELIDRWPRRGFVPLFNSAVAQFKAANGLPQTMGSVGDWQDRPERTLADVLGALDRAIGEGGNG